MLKKQTKNSSLCQPVPPPKKKEIKKLGYYTALRLDRSNTNFLWVVQEKTVGHIMYQRRGAKKAIFFNFFFV